MELKHEDVLHLSRLARIQIDDGEIESTLARLNQVFALIEKMQATDTSGLEPMTHPQADALRLRDDVVTESDGRDANQQAAPDVSDGLYRVPKVIE